MLRIAEILSELSKQGQTESGIAKQIEGIEEDRLKAALNEEGYPFRNHSPKGWFFVGKGAEPLEKSILEYAKNNCD